MPTVSREVLHSVPLFTFLIWVAGMVTLLVFFPSLKQPNYGHWMLRRVLTFVVLFALLMGGFYLRDKGLNKACGTLSLEEVSPTLQPVTLVECILTRKDNYREVVCNDHEEVDGCQTKFNLTVNAKIGLFVLGALWGWLVWPRRKLNGV